MEKEKYYIRIDKNGTPHSPNFYRAKVAADLTQYALKYCFPGSFDGKHALPEKMMRLTDKPKGM